MKLSELIAGITVYDVHSQRAGNTTMRTVGVWPVRILSVDLAKQTCTASWNGNSAKTFWPKHWQKWRLKKPVLIPIGCGCHRLAKRAEIIALERQLEGEE